MADNVVNIFTNSTSGPVAARASAGEPATVTGRNRPFGSGDLLRCHRIAMDFGIAAALLALQMCETRAEVGRSPDVTTPGKLPP